MGEASPGNGNFQTAEVRDHGLIRLDELPREEIDAHWALVRARSAGGEPASPPALVPEDDVRPMLALPPVPGSEKAESNDEVATVPEDEPVDGEIVETEPEEADEQPAALDEQGIVDDTEYAETVDDDTEEAAAGDEAEVDEYEEPADGADMPPETSLQLAGATRNEPEETTLDPSAIGRPASLVEFPREGDALTEAASRLRVMHEVVSAIDLPPLPDLDVDDGVTIRYTTAGHKLQADAIGERLDPRLIFGPVLPYWHNRLRKDVHDGQAMITEWVFDPAGGLSIDEQARVEEAIDEGREVQSLVKSKSPRDLQPVLNFILGGLVLGQRYGNEKSTLNIMSREWWDKTRDRSVVLAQAATAAWLLDLTHRQDLANINEKWAKLPLLTMVELDMRDNPHTRRIEPKTIARLRPAWYRGPLRRTAATGRYLSRADRELPKKLLAQEQALMLDHKRQLEAMAAAEGGAGHEDETGSE